MISSAGRSSYDFIVILLSVIYLAHGGSTFVAYYTPSIVWAFVSMGLFFLLLFGNISSGMRFRFLFPLVALAFARAVFFHFSVYGKESIIYDMVGFTQICVYPLLTYYLLNHSNKRIALFVLMSFVLVSVATGISTLSAYEMGGENFVRSSGSLEEELGEQYAMRMKLNVGNFDTVYGFATMLPVAIMFFKWRDVFRKKFASGILLFLLIALMVSTVYVGQYTISFMVCLLMLILFVCPKEISSHFFKRSLIIAIIAFVALRFFAPPLLNTLADFSNSDTMSARLLDVSNYLSTGVDESANGSDFTERNRVYNKSINSIKSTFLMGGWDYSAAGGHSFILDNIALMGLIGIFLLIKFYKSIITNFLSPYKRYPWIYYYYYGLIAAIIFHVLNPNGIYVQLLFVFPVSAYLFNELCVEKEI